MRSATIGLDAAFDSLTSLTCHDGIFAAIDAEGYTATDPSTQEEGETPNPGHSSWLLHWDTSRFSSAERTHVTIVYETLTSHRSKALTSHRSKALILHVRLIRRKIALVGLRWEWMVVAGRDLIVWILWGRRRAGILIVVIWLMVENLLVVSVRVRIRVLVAVLVVHDYLLELSPQWPRENYQFNFTMARIEGVF